MNRNNHTFIRYFIFLVIPLFMLVMSTSPAVSGEYTALDGVKGIKAVFDVSLESPAMANVVFGAVKEVYTDKNTRALSESPKIALVFHGPAVHLISTNRDGFEASDVKALDEFAETIRQMKKDGVTLEVCDYALKVLDVDPDSILPEVDHVGNGFISVIGFQAQGYSLVTVK